MLYICDVNEKKYISKYGKCELEKENKIINNAGTSVDVHELNPICLCGVDMVGTLVMWMLILLVPY